MWVQTLWVSHAIPFDLYQNNSEDSTRREKSEKQKWILQLRNRGFQDDKID